MVYSLTGQAIREVSLGEWTHLESLAWAADGQGFFLTAWASKGEPLLRASLDGRTWLLYKGRYGIFDPSPSPDGRFLAFGEVTMDSNAWVIETRR